MRVSVSGALSDFRAVLNGAPQGSILGPILFFVYVNHIVSGVRCSWKAFADDLKLYLSYPRDPGGVQQGVSLLQRDLDRVALVASSWNFSLNGAKCVIMRFHGGNIDWDSLDVDTEYSLGERDFDL
jgi:hypothetical protein